ncbi:MAG: hypothetical protein WKG01_31345 [Kofleriaceae bacterium]
MLVLCIAACGSRAPAPVKPAAVDPKRIAFQLHIDMKQLGEIATRLRGNCAQLVTELSPHVERMRVHADQAREVSKDLQLGKQLKVEIAAYDEEHAGLSDVIGTDLAATYQTCDNKEALRAVIDRIPDF